MSYSAPARRRSLTHAQRRRAAARTPRSSTLLPGAREIFAVRVTHQEERVNRHGVSTKVTITDPWPKDWDRDTVLARVNAAAQFGLGH